MQSALKPRCIACSNCVLACPFGVPEVHGRARPDDEVRHVLRPHVRRATSRCARRSARARRSGTAPSRSSTRTRRGSLVRRLPVRPPGRAHQGVHRRRRPRGGPARRPRRPTRRTWLDDPFGLDERGRRHERRRAERRRRPGSATSPTRPPARTRSPAASSPATSSLGAGAMAAGNVGLAVWTPAAHRSTPANPGRSSPLDDVAVGDTYLFRYPDRRRPGRSSSASPTREVVAFSQKCTHLGCVVYYQADEDRWHCPCHEGNFDTRTGAVLSGPPTATARPHRRRDPRRRHDLGARERSA